MEKNSVRNYGYDNLRCLLMICVVAAHLLEITRGSFGEVGRGLPYFMIYSFHMPAFIFLNGLFGKASWKRLIWFGGLYLVFQTAYVLFGRHVLCMNLQLQYHTPYWLLWYLLTYVYYLLALQILKCLPDWCVGILLAMSFIGCLLAGYDSGIGYPYSLSRAIVYFPFFLMGHLAGRYRSNLERICKQLRYLWPFVLIFGIVMSVLMYESGTVNKNMLYGSYGYWIGYGVWERLLIMLTAVVITVSLVGLFVGNMQMRVPAFTAIGQNSLAVFLLHGFIARFLGAIGWITTPYRFVIVVLVILLAGNPVFGGVLSGKRLMDRKKSTGNLLRVML